MQEVNSLCTDTPRGAVVPPFRLCSSLVHSLFCSLLLFPFSFSHSLCLVVYQMHLIDYLITLVSVRACVCVRVCVCLSADRLSNDYVRSSLPIFTKFCMPLRNVVVSNDIVSETNRK